MTNYTLGMDVSTWQEYVNWPVAVDKGVRFAYIRGAYGVTKDNKFDLHWGSSKGKLLRGVYLYYRDSQDPVQQADNLYAYCEAHGDFGELPPALDIEEYNNAQITPAKVKTCLERLEANFGIKPLVYTAQAVWDKWLGNVAWATEYDLWCSNPPWSKWFDGLIEAAKALDPNVWPHKPLPWKNAGLMQVIWQITFKAPASDYGVSGSELDLNFFSGTEAELYEYANGNINPPPPPVTVGEPILKFQTTKQYNIRPFPDAQGTLNDLGDIPGNVTVTAKEVQFTPNGGWVEIDPDPAWITKPSPTGRYWIAGMYCGQGKFLNTLPPEPCGENVPMTPEQLERLETLENVVEALQNADSPFVPTNRLETTKSGGEKLRAYPNGSEAVQLYDNDLLMDLNQTRAGQKLFAHKRQGVIITGFLDPAVIGAL